VEPAGNYIIKGEIYINDPSTCFICKKTDLNSENKYCHDCGFPQMGEQEEQKAFYRDHLSKQVEFNEAVKNAKGGQNILFIASGLTVLSSIIFGALAETDKELTLFGGIAMAGIFCGLGFWAKQKPLEASITGVIIYLTLILISVIVTITEGGRGIGVSILDVIIVVALFKGIFGSLKAERFKKEKGWDWKMNS
jgi:ribosomal protein L37E